MRILPTILAVLARIGLGASALLWLALGILTSTFVSASQDDEGHWMQGIDYVSVARAKEANAFALGVLLATVLVAALHLGMIGLSLVPSWRRRAFGVAGGTYVLCALLLALPSVASPGSAFPVYLIISVGLAVVCIRASVNPVGTEVDSSGGRGSP